MLIPIAVLSLNTFPIACSQPATGAGICFQPAKIMYGKPLFRRYSAKLKQPCIRLTNNLLLDRAAAFVMATLDRELILDDDQVQNPRSLVQQTDPHHTSTRRNEPSSYKPLKTDNAMASDLGFPGAATVAE
jgi:hypothetical protein